MLRFFGKGKALRAPTSRTKAQHFFPKIGWGGSEAVWKFTENSSNLVQIVFPNGGHRKIYDSNIYGNSRGLHFRMAAGTLSRNYEVLLCIRAGKGRQRIVI